MDEDRYFKIEVEVRRCLDCHYYGESLFHRSCLLAGSKIRYADNFEGVETLGQWLK